MATILSNGTNIYRYNDLILRSPLYKTITIKPTGQLLYDVGDKYVQQLPTKDFPTTTGSGVYSIMAGHSMRKAYLKKAMPTGAVQIWRYNNAYSTTDDSGYVFYQGNYSPASGMMCGSAFMRAVAYQFVIPSKYKDWKVESMTLTTKDHGTVLTSGACGTSKTSSSRYPVFAWDAATTILPRNSSWRDKNRALALGCFSLSTMTSNDAFRIYASSQQEITINQVNTDACSNAGGTNAYPLWRSWPSGSVTYSDGAIINAPSKPHTQNHTMNANIIDACNSIGSTFYLSLTTAVGDSGGSTYVESKDYPEYHYDGTSSYSNWWLCERYQITQIQVKLQLGE